VDRATGWHRATVALLLGDKSTFAAEVGDPDGPDLRRVDLWVAGQWLTCDDNTVYVPQFRLSVAGTLDGLNDSEHHALSWGPTTDNAQSYLYRDGDNTAITAQFWREDHLRAHPEHAGVVFTAEIPTDELIDILERLVAALQ
jgi:hypothetical protein